MTPSLSTRYVFTITARIGDVTSAGVLPFVATDLIRLTILIVFPLLATWLPMRMVG